MRDRLGAGGIFTPTIERARSATNPDSRTGGWLDANSEPIARVTIMMTTSAKINCRNLEPLSSEDFFRFLRCK